MRETRLSEVPGAVIRTRVSRPEVDNLVRPLFVSDSGSTRAYIVSPNHGRSAYLGRHDLASLGIESGHVFVKGAGLSLGTVPWVLLPKHGGSYYGLCTHHEALREWRHGLALESEEIVSARVLGVARIDELPNAALLPPGVRAAVVFSVVACPYRIGDVAFMDDKARRRVVESAMKALHVGSPARYILALAALLAQSAARLHRKGCANRTLYVHNVTCFGELVDFEAMQMNEGQRGLERLLPGATLELYNLLELLVDTIALFSVSLPAPEVFRLVATSYLDAGGLEPALKAVLGSKPWT